VHVSQLADRFVKDPHEVVKAGDVVKVRVVEVDIARKRIGLTMRKQAPAAQGAGKPDRGKGPGGPVKGAGKGAGKGPGGKPRGAGAPKGKTAAEGQSALGAALLSAMKDRR
jgi:uncharacterized protein